MAILYPGWSLFHLKVLSYHTDLMPFSYLSYALRESARQNFRPYLHWTRKPKDGVEIIDNPLNLQSDKRTAAYRKIQTAQRDFIEGLRTGGGQLRLPLDAPNSD